MNKEYDNGTKHSFIRAVGRALKETLQKLNDVHYGLVEAKGEVLDWGVIIPLYEKVCGAGGDIDDFCVSHVLGYSMLNGFVNDEARKEAMYIQLRSELYKRRKSEEIS